MSFVNYVCSDLSKEKKNRKNFCHKLNKKINQSNKFRNSWREEEPYLVLVALDRSRGRRPAENSRDCNPP